MTAIGSSPSTTCELDLDDNQKKDMMSFIKDNGKGLVGVHAELETNYEWPEYGEIIGSWFDQHPWSRRKVNEYALCLGSPGIP